MLDILCGMKANETKTFVVSDDLQHKLICGLNADFVRKTGEGDEAIEQAHANRHRDHEYESKDIIALVRNSIVAGGSFQVDH